MTIWRGPRSACPLARRFARQNQGNEYGTKVAQIADEIEEDKETLHRIMEGVGVRQKRTRPALAWVAEKAMRLKPHGILVGYSQLSRVLGLEGLTMGITGKLELWRSMDTVEDDSEVREADFARLIRRAEDQRDRVEDLRIRAAREALNDWSGAVFAVAGQASRRS